MCQKTEVTYWTTMILTLTLGFAGIGLIVYGVIVEKDTPMWAGVSMVGAGVPSFGLNRVASKKRS